MFINFNLYNISVLRIILFINNRENFKHTKNVRSTYPIYFVKVKDTKYFN